MSVSESLKKAQRKYQKTEKGKVSQSRYHQTEKGKAAHRRYRQSEKGKAAQKHFYTNHPNYLKAKSAVNNAIRDGKLPRPDTLLCHYCPKPAQQYHHWRGYEPEHWLDIVPVCKQCHHKCKKKIA